MSLNLGNQYVGVVNQLLALLDEPLCRLDNFPRAWLHFVWKTLAVADVGPNTLGQIVMASGTDVGQIPEERKSQFLLTVACFAPAAPSHGMIPTVPQQDDVLFIAQATPADWVSHNFDVSTRRPPINPPAR